jgi:hypothetical protein
MMMIPPPPDSDDLSFGQILARPRLRAAVRPDGGRGGGALAGMAAAAALAGPRSPARAGRVRRSTAARPGPLPGPPGDTAGDGRGGRTEAPGPAGSARAASLSQFKFKLT